MRVIEVLRKRVQSPKISLLFFLVRKKKHKKSCLEPFPHAKQCETTKKNTTLHDLLDVHLLYTSGFSGLPGGSHISQVSSDSR